VCVCVCVSVCVRVFAYHALRTDVCVLDCEYVWCVGLVSE
jgi:hypothetical protein